MMNQYSVILYINKLEKKKQLGNEKSYIEKVRCFRFSFLVWHNI